MDYKEPEIEDIMAEVSHMLPNAVRAEVIKWDEKRHEIVITVYEKDNYHSYGHSYNPKGLSLTRIGFGDARKSLVNEVINELRRYVNGL
jgi:hypothetical protein